MDIPCERTLPILRSYSTLQLAQTHEFLLEVTLSRPEAANALNTQMGEELLDAFSHIKAFNHEARAIILTGAGVRAFCAGGDLKERNDMDDAAWHAQHVVFEQMVESIRDCPVPVIGAINGAAYGGGTEIALCCDYLYAADHARFALTEASLGIMPGCGGTQNLPRAIGQRRALELILSAQPFTAQQAFDWGMVNRVIPGVDLLQACRASAAEIATNAPLATRLIKRSVKDGLDMDIRQAMAFEIECYNQLIPTSDRREGVTAFNERRKPRFQGG